MYKLNQNIKISQEQYNQINNASSNEDLLEIKNLFLSALQEENNENASTNNVVLCRILSNNEYTKYIINSTLDGAIQKNNENVWHIINSSYTWTTDRAEGTFTNNKFFILDILQNNKNNKNNSTLGKEITISIRSTNSRGGWNDTKFFNIEKEKSTHSFLQQTAALNGYNGRTIYLNTNMYCSFRPVFQYKDNNKSENIFN